MDASQGIETAFNDPEYIAESLSNFKNMNWNGKQFPDLVNHFRSTFKSIPFHCINIKKGTIFLGRVSTLSLEARQDTAGHAKRDSPILDEWL
jgi:hypothetical protein